ncbi:hypothetical protein LPJ61_001915 [Coemansia biformis]|uniref:SHSP domain-containing protein n=1 Tax=Coemansia biformis TaxID=1286918 RepID=A0A9W7YE12_9FUNG|nr:hypothetical protein LPJ61_001915 [Coemansia biformis]
MGRGRSNFGQDMFSDNPAFRTVHASTLPGRVRDTHEWMGWTWPRFRTALLDMGADAGAPVPAPVAHHAPRPSIFGQVFEPPEEAARITRRPDKWEIRLENSAFVGNETKVQVKRGFLHVLARSVRAGTSPTVSGWQGNAFEYSTALPKGFVAGKISARRDGAVLVVTVPIGPPPPA